MDEKEREAAYEKAVQQLIALGHTREEAEAELREVHYLDVADVKPGEHQSIFEDLNQ